MYKRNQKHKRS